MVTDIFKLKAFAGLFSAAPSVAIASLALTAALMSVTWLSWVATAAVVFWVFMQ